MKIIIATLEGEKVVEEKNLLGIVFLFDNKDSLTVNPKDNLLEIRSVASQIVVEPRAANAINVRESRYRGKGNPDN